MKILRPVPDRISQVFGANPKLYKRFGLLGHNGIDYASPKGREIKATDSGTVAYSYNDKDGYGEVIKLKHSWGESIYAHLNKRLVKKGARVKRGQVIGTVGSTGFSTGNHLHFGIRINPVNYNNGYFGWVNPFHHIEKGIMSTKIKSIKTAKQVKAVTERLGGKWNSLKNKTVEQWLYWIEPKTRGIKSKIEINKINNKIKTLDKQVEELAKENIELKKSLEICNKEFKDLTLYEKFQLLFKNNNETN